jgi:hypothetical protein
LHDSVYFEVEGLPTVVLASEEFGEAAAEQALALGLDEARYVLVEHPIQDASDQEMRVKADAIIEQVIAALISGATIGSGTRR